MALDITDPPGSSLRYRVDIDAGRCWVIKSRSHGREYLSTITSLRKIKRLLKLANAQHTQNQKTADAMNASGCFKPFTMIGGK